MGLESGLGPAKYLGLRCPSIAPALSGYVLTWEEGTGALLSAHRRWIKNAVIAKLSISIGLSRASRKRHGIYIRYVVFIAERYRCRI